MTTAQKSEKSTAHEVFEILSTAGISRLNEPSSSAKNGTKSVSKKNGRARGKQGKATKR